MRRPCGERANRRASSPSTSATRIPGASTRPAGRQPPRPLASRLPECFDADPERAHDADAGDRDGYAHAPRPEDERHVVAAEAVRRRDRHLARLAAAGHRHQVEILPRRVGCTERRRRRQELTVEREDRRRGLDRARRAQAVTELRLRGADRQAGEARPEHGAQHPDLDLVVLPRAGAVRVHVVDRVGRERRRGQRAAQGGLRAASLGIGRRHVVGVAAARMTEHTGDARARRAPGPARHPRERAPRRPRPATARRARDRTAGIHADRAPAARRTRRR